MTTRKQNSGFTLIELLATLTIMAIIAAALIPFIGNYTQKAENDTNLRSLKLFQDAVNRFVILNKGVPGTWGADGGASAVARRLLGETEEAEVIKSMTTPGESQTMSQTSPALTGANVEIMAEGDGATANWFIIRYRSNATGAGISRDGKRLIDGNSSVTATLNSNNTFAEGDGFDIGPAAGGAMVNADAGAATVLP